MKKFLLEESGHQTRRFETLKAVDKAMEERIEYWIGNQIFVKKFNKCRFEGYLDGKDIVISIIEKEVEG